MTTTSRPQISLRDYQKAAIAAVADAGARGIQRALVALPTGTGKTIIFAHQTADSDGDTLILVHRDELARQTVEKLHMVAPELKVGIVKAEQDEHDAHVVVASVQTLSRANRLARRITGFKQIIVDEAHHAVADTYQRIIEHFGGFEAGGPQVIGFTATPERGDKINLKHVWQEIVFSRDILKMIRDGYLVDLKGKRIVISRLNLDNVKRQNGDWQDAALAEEMRRVDAPNKIAEGYVKYGENRPSIFFTPTVATAYEVRDALRRQNVAAETVEAHTLIDERQEIYAGLRNGTVKVIVNCGVLTEGFDEPSASCIGMCRPTQSKPLYMQCIGRGTRTAMNKNDCLVLDFCGVSRKHEIATLDKLFDLTPKDLANGASVLEAVNAKEAREAAFNLLDDEGDIFGLDQQDGELKAKTVDLFNRKQIHWIPTNDGGYLVSISGGAMLVQYGADGLYKVVVRQQAKAERIVAEGVTLDYAQGIAEDEIRANGWIGLVKKDAAWRQPGVPMTEPQSYLLKKLLRRPLTAEELKLSKGDASDLITKLKNAPVAAAAPKQDWW